MAIANGDNFNQYDKVHEIIVDVLQNRKLLFTRETIIQVIKNRLIEAGMDGNITEEIYFNFLLDGNLNTMIECGIIYNFENSTIYEPLKYAIYNKHLDNCSRILYLSEDDEKKYVFINISNNNKSVARVDDYILTGGIKKGKMVTPEITYEEIKKLYDDCIKEGASNREALEHILNFYDIKHLSLFNDDYIHAVIVSNKTKKESVTHILKKDTKRKKRILNKFIKN